MAPEKVFAVLSNRTRLRCLLLAVKHAEVCVCDVEESLGISQSAASKALTALRDAGFLSCRRDATWSYYARHPDMPDWQATLLDGTLDATREDADFIADAERFARLGDRVCA